MNIPKHSRILLDTVALIYFLEGNPRYVQQAEKVFAQIEAGILHGLMANLVFAELLVPFYRTGDPKQATGLVNRLLSFRNLEVIAMNHEISMEAARLRAQYDLRTPDAIHAATAVVSKATGILTNDKRFKALTGEGLAIWLFDEMN
ncbi:MAG: PIN domain-containing protein [Chromatiales bacterium]